MEARQKAKEMGMIPNCFVSDQIENETSNDQEWFFKPFESLETNVKEDEDIHEKELKESEELEEVIPESTVLLSLPYLRLLRQQLSLLRCQFQVMEFSTKLHWCAC